MGGRHATFAGDRPPRYGGSGISRSDCGGQAPALRAFRMPRVTVGRGPVPRHAAIAGDRPPRSEKKQPLVERFKKHPQITSIERIANNRKTHCEQQKNEKTTPAPSHLQADAHPQPHRVVSHLARRHSHPHVEDAGDCFTVVNTVTETPLCRSCPPATPAKRVRIVARARCSFSHVT